MDLGKKLQRAREKRGWTLNEASRRSGILFRTSMLLLEQEASKAENIRLTTALVLVDLYHPDLALSDFYEGLVLHQIDRFEAIPKGVAP